MCSSWLGPLNSRGGGDGHLNGLGDAHLGDLNLHGGGDTCCGGDRDGDLILLGSGDVDLCLDDPAPDMTH